MLPVRLAINTKIWDPWYDYIDIVTFILYILDILFNLVTTYIDSFGDEITNWKAILKNYCISLRFVIDLLSLLNLPKLNNQFLTFFGILKLARFFRILSLITQSNMSNDVKIVLQIFFYYIFFLIWLHLWACIWFYVVLQNFDKSIDKFVLTSKLAETNPNIEVDSSLADSNIIAWLPPYDYYDGTEKFWEKYVSQEN